MYFVWVWASYSSFEDKEKNDSVKWLIRFMPYEVVNVNKMILKEYYIIFFG